MEGSDDDKVETFDDILATIGDFGRFQKFFNLNYNIVYAFVLAMTSVNFLIAVQTPDHWCHVPERPPNITVEEWRNLTIPLEINTKGVEGFSKCKMYKTPLTLTMSQNKSEIISCQHGWDYSKEWYEDTFTSSENWVCDKEYYVTDAFTASRIGDVLGTSLFGYLADITGRRPVFFVTVIGMVISRIFMLYTKSDYYCFMISSFFAWFTLNAGYQSPITIILEITNKKHRAIMVTTHSIGWIIGASVVPILMWAIRRADYFILATTLPGVYVLITYRYLIESPRWLLSRQRVNDCYKQLKIIARTNKRKLPDDILLRLKNISDNNKETQNSFSNVQKLFANWRLAKNTTVLTTCWSIMVLSMNILIFYVEILEGNPFMNFMLQIAIQIPSCLVGKILCDRFGRRFSFVVGSLGGAIAALALVFYIRDTEHKYIPITLTVTTKFFVSVATYVIHLQILEIYPTGIRQTGTSFCIVCEIALSTVAPYISSLGKNYDARYPYLIMFVTIAIATFLGPFLPETKNKNLPETVEEAKVFGADQSYFDFCGGNIDKRKSEKHYNSVI